LNHFAPGRVGLGLGLSSKTIVADWHGLAFSPSLQQIREAVRIIRLVAAGERVSVEGAFYSAKNFRLTAPAPTEPVRVFLAALGPEMLELAGEIADGAVLNWIPPETVPASIKRLETGARRGGRTLDGFELAAFVRTCVTDDVAARRGSWRRRARRALPDPPHVPVSPALTALGVIPARLASTRLPRKVLRDVAGKPLIVRVHEAARRSPDLADVLVATDAQEVIAACA